MSLARAFVNHPPLLLADEPTGNLDPETSIGIMQLLYRINRTGTTVIVATHDSEMVDKMRRRVIELSQGRIVRDQRGGSYRDDGDQRVPRHGSPSSSATTAHDEDLLPAEALRALKRNAAPSLAAFATVADHDARAGRVHPGRAGGDGEDQRGPQQDRARGLHRGLREQGPDRRARQHDPGHQPRRQHQFISKAEALSILKHRLGEKNDPITEGLLKSNPLPASYRIHLDDPGNVELVKNSLAPRGTDGRPHYISPAINDVKDREDDTKKILSATSTIKLLLAVLAGLLVLASILLVANTIRLSIFARRREVEVMRLVGATNWFIRWPFVIEGLVVGFFGAAFAVLLLWIAKVTIVDPWSDRFALIAAPRTISFTLLVFVLMGAGMAVSALGSGLTLRRFLRV